MREIGERHEVQIERRDKSQPGKKEGKPSIWGVAGVQSYRHSRGSGNPVLLPTLIEKLRKKFLFFLVEFI
jgi:hypothetical protein